jgi:uncharacterized protein DUF4012
LPGVQEEISLRPADRMRDISSWQEGDISLLSLRGKRRYKKRKSAIEEYFTTDATLDEIILRHHLPAAAFLNLVEKCLMRHEDGAPWGFRALLPGVEVIDHTSQPAPEEAVLPEEQKRSTRKLIKLTEEPDGHSVTAVASLVLPAALKKQANVALTKKRALRRLVRKHWQREAKGKQKQKRYFWQMLILAVLAPLVLFVLVPAGAGLAAYNAYNAISTMAHGGVNHLLKVKSILDVSKTNLTAELSATKLQQSQVEFKAAESDFIQLQQLASRPDIQSTIRQFAPQYSNELNMAQSLIRAALDVSRMGKELCDVALIGVNIIHGSPIAVGSTRPLISAADVMAIEGSLIHTRYYISDIRLQLSHVSIKDLPISNAQKAQILSVLPLLPKAEDMITQAQSLIGPISWLLGVGHPRRFLIQTMDTAELRPGGGFTGQYGILQIQDGRVTPPTLTDVTLIDYASNGVVMGRRPPAEYSWMTFPNWGLRDANLSGDFPTTARLAMQVFQDEGGGPVEGDIAFTPKMIGHIIDVTGPIYVPGFNETITSKNLEERIHYYQQDFSAIAREKQISGDYSYSGRKAFTSILGRLVLDRVRHLPLSKLVEVVKGAIKDIQSRDLEIYFTNPVAEAWLVEHGYSASIDTFSKQDGFMVTQGNFSISKASQYVHTTEQDDVTLDAQGNATHNLTITLDYQQTGPVYGYDTYADYIRVYAPQSATFISGDGFDSGKPGCASGCGQDNAPSPSDARYCPNGDYSLGIEWASTAWPVDSLGPPTEMQSDLPGRAMWGGLTLTPKNCISNITLSWSVPNAVQRVNGQPSYSMLVQKQSGVTPTIELTIDASAIKGLKSFQFTGDITTDKAFTLGPEKK